MPNIPIKSIDFISINYKFGGSAVEGVSAVIQDFEAPIQIKIFMPFVTIKVQNPPILVSI